LLAINIIDAFINQDVSLFGVVLSFGIYAWNKEVGHDGKILMIHKRLPRQLLLADLATSKLTMRIKP
jgi:hypothetical protein